MTDPKDWPEGLYPVLQSLYVRPALVAHLSDLTAHIQAAERDGSRWVAALDFRLGKSKAVIMDALLAGLKGPSGIVLVPDFRRTKSRVVTESMDAYAERIGLTFFDDEYDFTDMTQDGGILTFEESVPLGLEENILFCAVFDALLLSPDDIALLTEDGAEIWGENVDIPFLTESGISMTLEHGPPMEIGMERGYGMEAENGDDILFQVGGRFFEGVGTPKLVGGAWNRIAIDGLEPWLENILLAGESIQGSLGRAYLVLFDVEVNANGYGQTLIAPRIRAPVPVQELATGNVKTLMRLLDNDAGRNDTTPPLISVYKLRLEEVLP